MAEYLLGIDNGGTMSKSAIYDLEGNEIAEASGKTEMIMPKPGYTEKDMHKFWEAVCISTREVIQKAGIKNTDICAIAATGHGNGIYCIDEKGEPAYNAIISTDMRASRIVERWYSDGTFQKVHKKTIQSIWAGQPVALLRWFLENDPDVVRRTRTILMCKDYVRYLLTGEIYAEITDISGSGLLNVREARYDKEHLDFLGIGECFEKLPEIKGSTEICGHVTKEAAEQTGLAEGTPVAGGLFDVNACAVATGIIDDTKLCSIFGTWSINEYISREPVISEDLFMASIYCVPGYWLIQESSATSASNLEWFVTQFMNESKGSVYEECNSLVESVSPNDSDVVFLPFLFGTHAGPDATAGFIGLNGYHTKAHLLRALYEGVAFSHRYHIEKLEQHRKLPDVIRISGGAAKSRVWMQLFADLMNKRIEAAANNELGTLGAVLCAGIGTGKFDSFETATAKMVKVAAVYEPNPGNYDIYEKKYQRYIRVIDGLKPVWKSFI